MPPVALCRLGARLIDVLRGLLLGVGVTGAALALHADEERLFGRAWLASRDCRARRHRSVMT